MHEHEETINDRDDCREYTLALSKVIKCSDSPDIEKVRLLGFIRGIEFLEEKEADQ